MLLGCFGVAQGSGVAVNSMGDTNSAGYDLYYLLTSSGRSADGIGMNRLRTQIALVAALVAAVVTPAVGSAAAAGDPLPDEPTVTFTGGGWGHGIGMSQYGARGRAEAGQTAEEIIAFYYEGTNLTGAAGLALDPSVDVDDVDVRVGIANCSSFVPSGSITIAVDGSDVGTTANPIAIGRSYDGVQGIYAWQIVTGSGAHCQGRVPVADAGAVDLCGTGCGGAFLTISFTDGEPISVSAADRNGSEAVRSYAHGQIQMLPDGRKVPGNSQAAERCGNPAADDFCIVVGNMTMQEYIYGLAEVPASWHLEALRTQAIAGRSYALSRMSDRVTSSSWFEPFNLYSTTLDQYFVGWNHESTSCGSCRWVEAVDLTDDMFAAVGDQIATTFYSSSNGGHTAANEDVWSNTPFSYLRANPDPYDDHSSNPNGLWEHTYTLDDVSRWLQEYPYANMDVGSVERIAISDVPPSGRIDKALVTIYGSDRTLEVRKSSGDPYGYRFWNAIRIGCQGDSGCQNPLTTKMKINTFFDVPAGEWYSEAIQWVADAGISSGVSPSLFAPFEPNPRSSVALFLWRFADRPPAVLPSGFDDVAAGASYEEAVSWLLAEGITTGTSPTTFSPGETVTRGQAAAFLWRFAGRPVPEVDQAFVDVDPARYFAVPISWMVQWDITTGTSPTTFEPYRTLDRAEMATFLWRLAGKPGAFADGVTPPASMRTP